MSVITNSLLPAFSIPGSPTDPLTQQWDTVGLYLSKNSIAVDPINRAHTTPLIYAASKGHMELCRLLVGMGADLNARDTVGYSALAYAVTGSRECAIFLLEAGANPQGTYDGMTLLHLACILDDLTLCQQLLDRGVAVNATGVGPPPLPTLEKLRQLGLTQEKEKELIQHGLGYTPLHFAVQYASVAVVLLLLDKGADLHPMEHVSGTTPLFVCLLEQRQETEKICRLLLAKGESLDHPCYEGGETPLHIVCLNNEPQRVELLLRLGANPNVRDSEGRTPLHIACLGKRPQLVKLLLELGANPHVRDSEGRTPLHTAALVRDPGCISFLITHHAAVPPIDYAASTPLLYFLASHNSCSTTTSIYPALLAQDAGLTAQLLKVRLLGHRFSLKGEPFLSLGPRFTFPELAQTLQYYVADSPQERSFLLLLAQKLLQAVNNSLTAQDYLAKIKAGESVALEAGWANHAVTVVFWKEWLLKGNRGDYRDQAGLTLLRIQKNDSLEHVIQRLLEMGRHEDAQTEEQKENNVHFFNQELHEMLDLRQEHFIPLKDQKTGNCGWLAAKMSFRALLFPLYFDSTKTLKKIFAQVDKLYYPIIRYDRSLALSSVEECEKNPLVQTALNFEDLYQQLLFKCTSYLRLEHLQRITTHKPHLIHAKHAIDGKTPLHHAVCSGIFKSRATQYLLERGANPRTVDDTGQTSLHRAAAQGSIKTCTLLIERGALLDAEDNQGQTPLILAILNNAERRALLLLARGANPNAAFPLCHASAVGCLEVCQALIQKNIEMLLSPLPQKNRSDIVRLYARSTGTLDTCRDLLQKKLGTAQDKNGTYSTTLIFLKTFQDLVDARAATKPFQLAD